MKLFTHRTGNRRGFTLAEVLAALAFMAIVIPVAVEGLRLASVAGQLGARKTAAGQVAERVLNEMLLGEKAQGTTQSGVTFEGIHEFRWSARWETWPEDSINQVTIQVLFDLQGREYDVQLSTLVDTASTL